MKSDRFTKIMLVLIFLALVANLFKSSGIGELVYAYAQPLLPVEKVGTRVYKREYYKHYHKITCDCSSAFLKNGVTKEIESSTPLGMTKGEGATTF